MLLRDLLEDFSAPAQPAGASTAPEPSDFDLEGAKLQSFEEGYKAGWDDAIAAQSADQSRIASDFAQNLQDLSFTYHEAYSHVMNAMTPLLEEMVRSLLPGLAREALGLQIVEQLQDRAREIGSLAVEISVAPQNVAAIAPLLERDFGFPLNLLPNDTLGDGQADIRFGDSESQVDLTGVLSSIDEAVQGFAHETRRTAHG
ncbi:ABC transporter ATP-binding protein [Thalassococcus profundi]|nr:ABC transporter ATP-binding protein [Thalassococcus profundi]